MRNGVLACLATDVHHVKLYFSGRWFFGFRILAHVQSPKGQSYSNRNRAPTVMGCAVPCDQHHGAVDGDGDRHSSFDCSECLKRRIKLHGPSLVLGWWGLELTLNRNSPLPPPLTLINGPESLTLGYASGGTVDFARSSLGLCRPTPTRDRKQEKQRGTVKETHVGNVGATRNTKGGRKHFESKPNQ